MLRIGLNGLAVLIFRSAPVYLYVRPLRFAYFSSRPGELRHETALASGVDENVNSFVQTQTENKLKIDANVLAWMEREVEKQGEKRGTGSKTPCDDNSDTCRRRKLPGKHGLRLRKSELDLKELGFTL